MGNTERGVETMNTDTEPKGKIIGPVAPVRAPAFNIPAWLAVPAMCLIVAVAAATAAAAVVGF